VKSSKYILDASALLASIYNEKSKVDMVHYIENSSMHYFNVSEVLNVLHRCGMEMSLASDIVKSLVRSFLPCTYDNAYKAAEIKQKYKHLGISAGDSFCISSSIQYQIPVVTADKAWKEITEISNNLILIR